MSSILITDDVSSFRLTLTHDAANDPSSNLTLLYQQTHNTIQKREETIKVNNCLVGQSFMGSHCLRDTSPRAYTIYCYQRPRYVFKGTGQCPEDKVCYDGIYTQNVWMAYCISPNKYGIIPKSRAKTYITKTSTVRIRTGLRPSIGRNMAVEVVLGSDDLNASLFADTLQIEAQSVNELFGAESYHTLPGGIKTCSNCSSVLIQPIPEGTRDIKVSAMLPSGVQGNYYMGLISP
ncbi:hypothetical protein MMC20_007284 [Loxospora ochrophaea]|nr:hypothetical protein [Loxospora ochrophaea]